MLSRVANALYWLGRYLERAENSARFLMVTHSYAQELRAVSREAADQCWTEARVLLSGDGDGPEDRVSIFRRLLFDEELPNSVLSSVNRARENARGIRDAIGSEMWEELNVLHMLLAQEATATPSEAADLSLLRRLLNSSHLFLGIRDNTMSRSDEWHFLRLGEYLERGGMTTRLVSTMFSHPAVLAAAERGQNLDSLHLAATLRTCTAFEAFSRTGHPLTAERVAEFLLLDNWFPRSVEFCVQEISASLHSLSGTRADVFTNDAEQLCGRLIAELRFAGIDEIMGEGLTAYLEDIRSKLDRLGQAISQEYFP